MSFLSLRDSICARLKERVKDFVAVTTHGGRFDSEDLRRYATQAPCAIVGLLAVPAAEVEGGQVVVDLQWGIFLLGVDRKALRRDAVALGLVELTLGVVRAEETWDDPEVHMPDRIRADNHFSKVCDEQGVSLWSVTWRQRYDLVTLDVDALDDFMLYLSETTPADAVLDDTPVATDRDARTTVLDDLTPAGG